MDMTDKFVFIYRGDDGNIFNAGIIVGHSFEEVDKRARESKKHCKRMLLVERMMMTIKFLC